MSPETGTALVGRLTPGYDFAHAIVDDHSRLAYVELHDDEKAETVTAFVKRALVYFERRGITVKHLTDNGFSYVKNRSLRELLARRGIRHLTTSLFPAPLGTPAGTPLPSPPVASNVRVNWNSAKVEVDGAHLLLTVTFDPEPESTAWHRAFDQLRERTRHEVGRFPPSAWINSSFPNGVTIGFGAGDEASIRAALDLLVSDANVRADQLESEREAKETQDAERAAALARDAQSAAERFRAQS